MTESVCRKLMGRELAPEEDVVEVGVEEGSPDLSSVSFIISSIAFMLCVFSIFTSCLYSGCKYLIFRIEKFYLSEFHT